MCQPGWRQARTAAQQPRDLAPLRRVRDRIDRDFAEPLNIEALARRIERAMALLRRGNLSVTAAHATSGIPPCVAKQVARPIRNREATEPQPQLA